MAANQRVGTDNLKRQECEADDDETQEVKGVVDPVSAGCVLDHAPPPRRRWSCRYARSSLSQTRHSLAPILKAGNSPVSHHARQVLGEMRSKTAASVMAKSLSGEGGDAPMLMVNASRPTHPAWMFRSMMSPFRHLIPFCFSLTHRGVPDGAPQRIVALTQVEINSEGECRGLPGRKEKVDEADDSLSPGWSAGDQERLQRSVGACAVLGRSSGRVPHRNKRCPKGLVSLWRWSCALRHMAGWPNHLR